MKHKRKLCLTGRQTGGATSQSAILAHAAAAMARGSRSGNRFTANGRSSMRSGRWRWGGIDAVGGVDNLPGGVGRGGHPFAFFSGSSVPCGAPGRPLAQSQNVSFRTQRVPEMRESRDSLKERPNRSNTPEGPTSLPLPLLNQPSKNIWS